MPAWLKPGTAFLCLALAFGLGFLVLLPPFQAPDEPFHLLRAYQISMGQWGETLEDGRRGAVVPGSAIDFFSAFQHVPLKPAVKVAKEEILRFRERPREPKATRFIGYATALAHPAWPYLPQALGMGLGRALELPAFYLLYLGRLFNLLAWAALVYAAIRRAPILPWLLFLLALTPISLQQAASLSPDAVTNGLAFLLFAGLLRLWLGPEEVPAPAAVAGTMALGLLLTLSKFAYGLHALLFLLIPWQRFGSRRRRILGMALFLGLNLAWMLHTLRSGGDPARAGGEGSLLALLQDPVHFFEVGLDTFRVYGLYYLEQFVGRLGHLDTNLPRALIVYYWLLLLGAVLLGREPGRGLKPAEKAWIAGVLLAEVAAIWLGLLLTYNPEGAELIRGGQGRYLIPLAPFFFLLLYRPAAGAGPRRWIAPVCVYSAAMALTVALFSLTRRFYG